MRGVLEGFPSLKNRFKIDRIYSFFEKLPSDALKFAIDEVCDEASPTPAAFRKAARDWKSDFYKKNGYYYGYEEQANQEPQYCPYCFDCGVVKVKHNTPDDFLQLMRCSCDAGLVCQSKLPHFNNDAKAMFVRVALNPAWFNPNITEKDDLDQMGAKVQNKFDQWQNIIRKSEKYWAGLGYKN
jgi:hypothetical protein